MTAFPPFDRYMACTGAVLQETRARFASDAEFEAHMDQLKAVVSDAIAGPRDAPSDISPLIALVARASDRIEGRYPAAARRAAYIEVGRLFLALNENLAVLDRLNADGSHPILKERPSMDVGQHLQISVIRIVNGFLVSESKSNGYPEKFSDPLFYPTFEDVEAGLADRLRAADAMESEDRRPDF